MRIQIALLNLIAASAGAFGHPARLFGFVAAAMVLPFILLTIGESLSNSLPWYFWATIVLTLLAVISVGFWRFTRVSHEAEDISISPERVRTD